MEAYVKAKIYGIVSSVITIFNSAEGWTEMLRVIIFNARVQMLFK